jgi:hypothetical protein
MKILMETNKQGRLIITNEETGEDITNQVGRIDIYINSQKHVSATLELRDVQLKLKVSSYDADS